MANRAPRRTDWQRQLDAQRRAAERAQVQAAREAERQRKLAEKQRREAYLQSRADDAEDRTAQLENRMRELTGLLSAALETTRRRFDPDALRRPRTRLPIDLGDDARARPRPVWEQYVPIAPSPVARLFGGEGRYARRYADAEQLYQQDLTRHDAAESARQQRVDAIRRDHAERQAAADAEVAAHNQKVDRFVQQVRAGDRNAVSKYYQLVIDQTRDAAGFPRKRRAGYVPESNLLAVEWRLPGVDIVPDKKAFRYVKTRDAIEGSPRSATEIRATYQRLVAQLALRALHVVFNAGPRDLVSTVVFNGIAEAVDPSTGQTIRPCLITLRATREQFESLVLAKVDPVACIRKYFAADVSPHPEELQAVQPVMEFEMADPRIIDAVDVISGIDKRPNLLELTPKDFEHFVHNLFARMGLDTKLFKADGDGGVDCVAYDPTPVFGGKYVIQAKLYNKTVPPAAVRDLYGTMQHEGATKGILITTSGYGPSSYEFANGKPLQLIDGTGLLAICKTHDIPARIVKPRI